MKKLLLVLLVSGFAVLGYWYGYRVGFQESLVLSAGGRAFDAMERIEELKSDHEANPQDLYEIQIDTALMTYGEYLEHLSIPLPVFYSARPAIEVSFEQIASYRIRSPRIREGKRYAPFVENYKEMDTFRNLPAEQRESFEKREEYYKRALEVE